MSAVDLAVLHPIALNNANSSPLSSRHRVCHVDRSCGGCCEECSAAAAAAADAAADKDKGKMSSWLLAWWKRSPTSEGPRSAKNLMCETDPDWPPPVFTMTQQSFNLSGQSK
jgi:hypothetical protein